jgi:pimeloyl-ACP methyl ester carboxylesterase
LQEKTLNLGGRKVFYREIEGTKTPVLFLHGKRFTSQDWLGQKVIDKLAALGHRVIALDLPGYGQSDELNGLSFSDFFTEVETKLNLDNFYLVGPSFGGKIALERAIKGDHKLSGLVVIAPAEVDNYLHVIHKVHIPVLIVWGEEDKVVPVEYASRLAAVLPQREVHIIRSRGHTCYFEEPELFADIVINFLHKNMQNK